MSEIQCNQRQHPTEQAPIHNHLDCDFPPVNPRTASDNVGPRRGSSPWTSCEVANSTEVGVMYLLCSAVAHSRSNTDHMQTPCSSSHSPANPSYHLATVTILLKNGQRAITGARLGAASSRAVSGFVVSRQTLPAAPAAVRVYLQGRKAGVLRRNVPGAVG